MAVRRTGMANVRTAVALIGLVVVTGCAAQVPVPAAPSSSSVSAELPLDYTYLLASSCGERALLGDYRVVVQDGDVVEVTGLDPDYGYRPEPEDVPSLADLLRMAEEAEPDAVVGLVTGADGVPVSLSIDHVPNGVDDEECYEVSELELGAP